MARSDIQTLLPLDQYAQIIGVDPRHFNQVVSRAIPDSASGGKIIYQKQWMKPGRASRDEIARAIAYAEERIADIVHFWPSPKYIENEIVRFPPGSNIQYGLQHMPWLIPSASGTYRPTVNTKFFRFIAGGKRASALIESEVTVTYLDIDGDGWDEIAEITLTVADTSSWTTDQIAVFPPTAKTQEQQDRIRCLDVTFTGTTTITIRGQSAWFVVPSLWEDARPGGFVDGDEPTSFLSTVNVYRVYTESNETHPPVEFGWESATYPTALETLYGVLQTWQPEQGIQTFHPATWDSTAGAWALSTYGKCRPPDLMKLSYVAGWPLTYDGRMSEPFATAVAALATAHLVTPLTDGGESIEGIYTYWQERMYKPSYAMSTNPFGLRYGDWVAWQTVKQYAVGQDGFSV